ncbi:chorismate-binding protein, partial [Balneolaceae bacterium ANBcel3]|nr:chorismate-binding protein [Balneolaceae bacterium ANBcel3]
TVCSHPIKGTAPRGKNPEDDRLIIENILNQDKNVAENVMIVDLVRNDLSVVAETGSVRVENLLDVQSFATVHQLVSEITARAKSDTSAVDIIKSCFPMGSMTGAPKIRTMELIETYESYRRGLYSGAIGFFTPKDDFDFNVVIRTAILKEDSMYYSVGGAITSGSDPRDEWKESWLKAKALEVITESPGANLCPADKKNLSCFES